MNSFFKNIVSRFIHGNILERLIFINIFVFLVIQIFRVVCNLFYIPYLNDFLSWFSLSSDLSKLIYFWTPLSYMFIQMDFWHICMNLLVLYYSGNLFLQYFSQRHLLGLYLLGGISGAIFYLLAFNYIPFYINSSSSLIGASAAIMAILFGVTFYNPQLRVKLPLINIHIKLIYISLLIFVIDFLSLDSIDNPGGHVSHIGGALVGICFAEAMLRGTDITSYVNKGLDYIIGVCRFSLFNKKKSTHMHVKYTRRQSDYEYNLRKKEEQENIDKILDKVRESGYSALSEAEKKELFNAHRK